jgi:high-affinity iron transporter
VIASFIITLREGLEAALIIGVLAAYLAKIGRRDLNKYIYMGTGLAVMASIVVAGIFALVYGGLSGEAGELFEGIATLSASAVLTYMIFWMAKHSKEIKGELQRKVDIAISTGAVAGLVGVAFISVFREGVETVLFLGAIAFQDPIGTFTGLILGVAVAVGFAVMMFKGVYRLDIRKFFKYTSIILIVFAAGLTAYGVHELNEAGVIPPVIEHVWDINPPINPDGTYPLLHEKGAIGSILKSLFGYNGNPSLTEVLAYLGYWLIIGTYVMRSYKYSEKEALAPA